MDPRRRALLALLAAAAIRPAFAQTRIMTKPIPSTGEQIPLIGLGTWLVFDVGSGERAPLREVLKLLNRNLIDSSPMYGGSESVAGDLIAELGLRSQLFVATKVWTRGRAEGIKQMETSFKRLRVQQMDLMQIHNLLDVETHTKTLLEMKSRKRIRYLGITHYTSSAYAEVERCLKTKQYDFLQINYSLGERESEKRILEIARDLRMAVIANRPFAEGALFRRVKGKPLPPWAAELGIASWAQYFLKWIVSHPAVTCAIPGTGNPKHMQDNLGAGQPPLPTEDQRKKMADYFDGLG
jgi:diketogulonate reductase-like aldo/keto reductase